MWQRFCWPCWQVVRMDSQSTKERMVYGIFERISQGYDRANARISMGMHRRWKRMLTDRLAQTAPAGGSLLDVCCGTGDIALEAARRRPDLEVTGLDFSPAMLREAEGRSRDLSNVQFVCGSAMELPFPEGRFPAISISFGLRNTADYSRVLGELRRVTAPGGMVYCLDSFVPENRLVRPFYRLYFRYLMPLLGGGGKERASYRWLYESTEQFLRREELEALFRTVGLTGVGSESRMFGACVLVWGRA